MKNGSAVVRPTNDCAGRTGFVAVDGCGEWEKWLPAIGFHTPGGAIWCIMALKLLPCFGDVLFKGIVRREAAGDASCCGASLVC